MRGGKGRTPRLHPSTAITSLPAPELRWPACCSVAVRTSHSGRERRRETRFGAECECRICRLAASQLRRDSTLAGFNSTQHASTLPAACPGQTRLHDCAVWGPQQTPLISRSPIAIAFRFSDGRPPRRSRLHSAGRIDGRGTLDQNTRPLVIGHAAASLSQQRQRDASAQPCRHLALLCNSPHGDGRPTAERRPSITRVAGSSTRCPYVVSTPSRAMAQTKPSRDLFSTHTLPAPLVHAAASWLSRLHFKTNCRIPLVALAERRVQCLVRGSIFTLWDINRSSPRVTAVSRHGRPRAPGVPRNQASDIVAHPPALCTALSLLVLALPASAPSPSCAPKPHVLRTLQNPSFDTYQAADPTHGPPCQSARRSGTDGQTRGRIGMRGLAPQDYSRERAICSVVDSLTIC
ncbi:hypothetical protein BU16DRAFT_538553 [Lophium mytilinum]|uniref:Uncharacterized protein n=1 Tax=Lophium mytilinum TaxID=390894 RepID=A0A6A6QVL4_9PEZI|nr:hypothetical protein BU16DRAFT_538553 [Lophium mytilinum]